MFHDHRHWQEWKQHHRHLREGHPKGHDEKHVHYAHLKNQGVPPPEAPDNRNFFEKLFGINPPAQNSRPIYAPTAKRNPLGAVLAYAPNPSVAESATSFASFNRNVNYTEELRQLPVQSRRERLVGLDPTLLDRATQVIADLRAQGFHPRVGTDGGVRTPKEQAQKVRQGFSGTYNSYHTKGLALDIVSERGWNEPLNSPFWKALHNSAVSHGLESGSDWRHPDVAHIQLSNLGSYSGNMSASSNFGAGFWRTAAPQPQSTATQGATHKVVKRKPRQFGRSAEV